MVKQSDINFEIMSMYDVPRYFGKKDTVIIDIRKIEDYKAGHIPTARHYSRFGCDAQLTTGLDELLIYKHIIVYCDHGISSIRACVDLSENEIVKLRQIAISSIYGGISHYRGIRIKC